jgi:HSP20 family protein
MALMRYAPWSLVPQLHDEINRVFNSFGGQNNFGGQGSETTGATANWVPAVDINELGDRFELCVDLPGVDPDKVEVNLENSVLTISGERTSLAKGKEGDEVMQSRLERGHGRFYRRFILPDTVDAERVKATGKNGVLEITIPKQAKALPRRIKVAA